MARIVDEAGVEIQPETAGFGAQLRADVDRGLTEATAGQDRTVRIRVTTDADAAEAQLRRVLTGIGTQVEQLANRVQQRATRLTTALEARVVRIATRIRVETVKLRTKLTEVMTPFWARLRGELARVQRGWQAVQNVARRAADATRERWVSSLDAAARGWRLVEAGAKSAGDRIGRAIAPALARVRGEILRLKTPFDVVRAYGVASFRILGDGGRAAFRRLRVEVEPDLRMIRASVDRIAVAGRAAGGALSTAFTRARDAAASLGVRINQASRYTDEYERIVKRTGVTVASAARDMNAALEEQLDTNRRLTASTEAMVDVRDRQTLAELAVSKAQREAEQAARAVTDAEGDLKRAREGGKATADELAEMEATLVEARERATRASVKHRRELRELQTTSRATAAAEREHAQTLSQVEESHRRVERSSRIHNAATRESGTVTGVLRRVVQGVTGTLSNLASAGFGAASDAATSFAPKLGNVATMAVQALMSILKLGAYMTVFLAIAGAVTFAVGAVGAAIAGLPALIGLAVASFGVLALGMDGIKKAYEAGLKPALQTLKTQVSDVFEETLTPAMRRLGEGLIPAITNNVKGLAQSFADAGVQLIDMVNRGDNVVRIQQIIDNTAASVTNLLSPALQNIVQQFINIGAQRPIMNAMVGIISDLINNVANWLGEMDRLNVITPAVEALRRALDTASDAILKILGSAMRFFTQAEPGFSSLMTSVGDLASTLIDDLGGAFNTALQAASDFIDNIPKEDLDRFKEAVMRLADSFMSFANSSAPSQIINFVTDIIETFSTLIDIITAVSDAFGWMDYAAAQVDLWAGVNEEAAQRTVDAYERSGDAATDMGDRTTEGVETAGTAAQSLGPAATQGADAWRAGIAPIPVDTNSSLAAAAENVRGQGGLAAQRAGAAGVDTSAAWQQGIAPIPVDTNSSLAAAAENVRGQGGLAAQRATAGAQQTAEQWRAGLAPIAPDTNSSMAAAAEEIRGQGGVAAQRAGVAGHDIQVGVVNPMTGIPEQAGAALAGLPPAIGAPMTESARQAADGARAIAISFDLNPVVLNTNTSMSAIQQSVGTGMEGVRATVQTGAQGVVDAANNMAAQVSGAGDRVRGSLDGMAGAVEGATGRVRGSVDGMAASVDGAAGRVTASLDGAATAGAASMNRLADAVQAAGQRAAQVTTDSFRQMQDAIRQSLDESVRITEDSWRKMETAFRDGGRKVVDISRDTAKQVVSAITEQSGAMYDAGVTLIERLAAGMTSAQGRATAAAARVAASIKAQFPSSPAKEGPLSGRGDPLRSGGTIIARLSEGITSRARLVADALRPVLARLRDSLSGLAPGGRNGMIQAEDGSWVNPDFYSGRPKRPVATLTSSVRDTAGPSTVRPRGEAEQAGSAADYDALRSAVELGIQTGIAEAMRPISATGLARINAKGQKDLQRR